MSYKRQSKFDFGDYNRKRKHLPYSWKGKSSYSNDDKYIIPMIVSKSSIRMKTKQEIKKLLDD